MPHTKFSRAIDAVERWPRLAGQVGIVAGAVIVSSGLRLLLEMFVTGAAPFPLTFPAVIVATLLAGARAGILTTAGCMLFTWYFIMAPAHDFGLPTTAHWVSLALTTATLLLIVYMTSAYRQLLETRNADARRKTELLTIALDEIDHRTKNNFQLAASILTIQAAQTNEKRVAAELRTAATRIHTIAATYKNLSLRSASISEVLLHQHLADICTQLRAALLPPTVAFEISADPVTVPAEHAVSIGLIVNEWITNAAKHACSDGACQINVLLKVDGQMITVEVVDDGSTPIATGGGRGMGLVELLAGSMNATIEHRFANGNACVLHVPL